MWYNLACKNLQKEYRMCKKKSKTTIHNLNQCTAVPYILAELQDNTASVGFKKRLGSSTLEWPALWRITMNYLQNEGISK